VVKRLRTADKGMKICSAFLYARYCCSTHSASGLGGGHTWIEAWHNRLITEVTVEEAKFSSVAGPHYVMRGVQIHHIWERTTQMKGLNIVKRRTCIAS
jgi:hypothetical protein